VSGFLTVSVRSGAVELLLARGLMDFPLWRLLYLVYVWCSMTENPADVLDVSFFFFHRFYGVTGR